MISSFSSFIYIGLCTIFWSSVRFAIQLRIPDWKKYLSLRQVYSSITVNVTHGHKYAVWRYLVNTTAALYFVVSKIKSSAKNFTVVPVLSVSQIVCTSPFGTHLLYFCSYISPLRCTCTTSSSDSAFTTEAPTQCKPPEILYADFSNLPPAWSTVNTASSTDLPVLVCTSTGIPRPSSFISTRPFSISLIVIWLQWPAIDSSIALSTISVIIWCKPVILVVPIYIPGLWRTGSSHSSITICSLL